MAEYQFEVAHAAIDSGADIILGSHPHLLKAFEVYKGKVIFHSLGNFLCDSLKPVPGFSASRKIANLREANTHHKPDPEYGLLGPRPGDLVNTGIGKVVIRDKKVVKVSFIPMLADPKKEFEIRPLEAGGPEFTKIVNYIKDITKVGGVNTEFKVEGGELVVVIPEK
jgi:poly-gamma-glutamate synthesis protein (capsule biosynthesis protein)